MELPPLHLPPIHMPQLTKNEFINKLIMNGVILLLAVYLFLFLTSVPKPEKKQPLPPELDVTKEIMANPFLQNRTIWKVDSSTFFTADQEYGQSETLGSMESLEMLLENSFQFEDTEKVTVPLIKSPEVSERAETKPLDVKSANENTLLTAAKSKIHIHTVQVGETLWDISRKYGIDIQTIIGANLDVSSLGQLKAGQQLKVLNTKGVIHKISSYETIYDVARLYKVTAQKIISHNGKKTDHVRSGDLLIVPGASPTTLSCRGGFSTGYIWPVGGRISSGFGARWGRMHNGIDQPVPTGTSVRAAKSGKVIVSGWQSGYGYAVYIKHDDNTITRYGHNSKLLVKKDDFVYQGQTIARSGNTGISTAPHVHFEIRLKGKAVNPLKYLP